MLKCTVLRRIITIDSRTEYMADEEEVDIYERDETPDELLEDNEITDVEEGFMMGESMDENENEDEPETME